MSAAQVGVGHLEKFQESGCNFPHSRPYCSIRRLAVQMAKEPKMNNSKFIGLLLLVAMGLQGCVAKPGGDAVSSASSLPATSPTYTEATCPDFCVSEERIVLIGETNSSLSKEIDVWSKSGGFVRIGDTGGLIEKIPTLQKISDTHWKLIYTIDDSSLRDYERKIHIERRANSSDATPDKVLAITVSVSIEHFNIEAEHDFVSVYRNVPKKIALVNKASLQADERTLPYPSLYEGIEYKVTSYGRWEIIDADAGLEFSKTQGKGSGLVTVSVDLNRTFDDHETMTFSILNVESGERIELDILVVVLDHWSISKRPFELYDYSNFSNFSAAMQFKTNIQYGTFNQDNPLQWKITKVSDDLLVNKTEGLFDRDELTIRAARTLAPSSKAGSICFDVVRLSTAIVEASRCEDVEIVATEPIVVNMAHDQWPAGEIYEKDIDVVIFNSVNNISLESRSDGGQILAQVGDMLYFYAQPGLEGVYRVQPWPEDIVSSFDFKIMPYDPVPNSIDIKKDLIKKVRYQFSSQNIFELDVFGRLQVLKAAEDGWEVIDECLTPSGKPVVDVESVDDWLWVATQKEIWTLKYDNNFCEWSRQKNVASPIFNESLISHIQGRNIVEINRSEEGFTYFVNDVEGVSGVGNNLFEVIDESPGSLKGEVGLYYLNSIINEKVYVNSFDTNQQRAAMEKLRFPVAFIDSKSSVATAVSRDGKAVWRLFKDGDSIWLNEYVASDLLAGVIKPKRYAPSLTAEQKAALVSPQDGVDHASIQFLPQKQAIVVGLNRLIWTLDLRPAQN
jgi:hypothetical protein